MTKSEIICRADGMCTLAGQIEARFEKARAQVEKLTPAFPDRAFKGEL